MHHLFSGTALKNKGRNVTARPESQFISVFLMCHISVTLSSIIFHIGSFVMMGSKRLVIVADHRYIAAMPNLLYVMLGGAVGSAARWEIGRLALHRIGPGYPWGTLIVNLAGGLLMGVLAGLIMAEGRADRPMWLLLGVGVLGGFTTFSAFSLDVFTMLQRGQAAAAFGYVTASVVGSVLLLMLGYWLARTVA